LPFKKTNWCQDCSAAIVAESKVVRVRRRPRKKSGGDLAREKKVGGGDKIKKVLAWGLEFVVISAQRERKKMEFPFTSSTFSSFFLSFNRCRFSVTAANQWLALLLYHY